MTNEADIEPPELDAPGAGLPAIQEFLLKHIGFPILRRAVSWDRAASMFEREGQAILTLMNGIAQEDRFKRVLVPRIMGIEDSSRYWSAAMTLDHLMIVTKGVMALMAAMSHGERTDYVVDTAKVKPGPNTAKNIAQQYRDFLATFRAELEACVGDKRAAQCHVHPWFGCLNPHGWLLMLAIHQYIHRKQLAQIRKCLVAA